MVHVENHTTSTAAPQVGGAPAQQQSSNSTANTTGTSGTDSAVTVGGNRQAGQRQAEPGNGYLITFGLVESSIPGSTSIFLRIQALIQDYIDVLSTVKKSKLMNAIQSAQNSFKISIAGADKMVDAAKIAMFVQMAGAGVAIAGHTTSLGGTGKAIRQHRRAMAYEGNDVGSNSSSGPARLSLNSTDANRTGTGTGTGTGTNAQRTGSNANQRRQDDARSSDDTNEQDQRAADGAEQSAARAQQRGDQADANNETGQNGDTRSAQEKKDDKRKSDEKAAAGQKLHAKVQMASASGALIGAGSQFANAYAEQVRTEGQAEQKKAEAEAQLTDHQKQLIMDFARSIDDLQGRISALSDSNIRTYGSIVTKN